MAANSTPTPVPASIARHPVYSAFYTLIGIYAVSRILEAFPLHLPMIAIVALDVLPALLFAFLHGRMLWSQRDILIFFAICAVVGGTIEKIGITTSFPFGRYFFTHVMGPKISGIPILLGLAYLGMGYLSWLIASLILGCEQRLLTSWRIVALPAFAALVMTSWDFCMDPIWSTVVRAWTWIDGGPYFGVPISNFFGWYANVFLIYLLFALSLRRSAPPTKSLSTKFWKAALLFYAVSVAGNFLLLIPHPTEEVMDPTGKLWPLRSITSATALATLLTMGTLLLTAYVRVARHSDPDPTQNPL
jgi:uncharacterized membrane protein